MTTTKRLVLYNTHGEVTRVFPWHEPKRIWAIIRGDNRRLEVHSSLAELTQQKIAFHVIKEISAHELAQGEMSLASLGHLTLENSNEISPVIVEPMANEDSFARRSVLGVFLLYVLISLFILRPWQPVSDVVAEAPEKKTEIVKIVNKKLIIPPQPTRETVAINQHRPVVKNTEQKLGWQRQGALAALGQLAKSNQQGGLNLGAMKTSAGPGLGGSQGSGGVQQSLYGKGLVAAPLGAGQNLKGGGGYGTVGRGGGKAGFGSMSLIGSTGASLIPIPSEAAVEGGLSSDLIAEVVRRNLGQVRFCYEKGLQLDGQLAGRVNVAWTIDGNGQVKVANIKNTSLNSKIVEECILQRLMTWKFPLPQNKSEVKVSYPFLLKRVGSS